MTNGLAGELRGRYSRILVTGEDAETQQREGYTLLDETDFGTHVLLFEKTETVER